MKNAVRVAGWNFGRLHYLFLDCEEHLADALLLKHGVKVYGGRQYVKENCRYRLMECKVRKKDEEKFWEVLSELENKMLLMGYHDYLNVCDEIWGQAKQAASA